MEKSSDSFLQSSPEQDEDFHEKSVHRTVIKSFRRGVKRKIESEDQWTDDLRLQLLDSYIKHLNKGQKRNAVDRVLHELNSRQNYKFSREMVISELERLRQHGQEMLKLEGCQIEWPLMDEIKQMLCLEGSAPIEVMRDYFSAENGIIWSEEDTKHLIETYTTHLIEAEGCKRSIWSNVISSLSSDITSKYTKEHIKLRLTNLKMKYFDLRENMKEGEMIKWPLYNTMENLYRAETNLGNKSEQDSYSADELVESTEQMRWTWNETKSLVDAYKLHLDELLRAGSFKEKGKVWWKISSDVVMARKRKCNPYLARMKIENMKKTWRKQVSGTGRLVWPYYEMMADLTSEERRVMRKIQGIEEEDSTIEQESEKSSVHRFAPWLDEFAAEIRQMHNERLTMKRRIIELFKALGSEL